MGNRDAASVHVCPGCGVRATAADAEHLNDCPYQGRNALPFAPQPSSESIQQRLWEALGESHMTRFPGPLDERYMALLMAALERKGLVIRDAS